MKPTLLILLLFAGAATAYVVSTSRTPTYTAPKAGEQETIPLALTAQPAEGEVVRTLQVEGMCCGGCRPKIYDALVKVPGVRAAAVEVGTAVAIVGKDVDVASLEKALTFDEYVAHARP